KNYAAVLRANVGALAVKRGRVVEFPEDLEECFITYFLRVVSYFNYFSVAGGTGANFFVGRVFGLAAFVATLYFLYAFQVLENGFGTPKTAHAKSGFFGSWLSGNGI